MATPSKNKNAVPYHLPSLLQTQNAPLPAEVDEVPPSSACQMIPSSTGKLLETRSYSKKPAARGDRTHLMPFDQTPSRGSAKFLDHSSLSMEDPPVSINFQSQVQKLPTWTSGVQETPSKTSDHLSSTPIFNIQVTPCKAAPVRDSPLDAPSPCSQVEEPDVYASLGWDYEVDD